jgi:hypothetical protein
LTDSDRDWQDRHFLAVVLLLDVATVSLPLAPHDDLSTSNYVPAMTESASLSRQVSNETATPPPAPLKLVTIRTHTSAFSPSEVVLNPSLVPFAKPGSLLQIIPQSDIDNDATAPSDRYIFRLGAENEKDFATKYPNVQLSVDTEVAKAFKFLSGNNVAVALV